VRVTTADFYHSRFVAMVTCFLTSDCRISILKIYKKARHTYIFQFLVKLWYIVMAFALLIVKCWYVQAVVYLFVRK
jgi:hypothetical protein